MLGMIWAQAHGGVIGKDNALPWHLPEDLAHFKATTHGHAVIMGRRQWESLPERVRPLPGRRNIVISRDADYEAPGAEVVGGVLPAAELLGGAQGWIVGGGQIYTQAIEFADVLLITEIDLQVDGDVFAPPLTDAWQVVAEGEWSTSRTGLVFRILRYERRAEEEL